MSQDIIDQIEDPILKSAFADAVNLRGARERAEEQQELVAVIFSGLALTKVAARIPKPGTKLNELGYIQPIYATPPDPRTHCVLCVREIPPGKPGRQCHECRANAIALSQKVDEQLEKGGWTDGLSTTADQGGSEGAVAVPVAPTFE